jgi:hypothetical protein
MAADEEATVRDLEGHIGTYGGRAIDTAGDGILAEFASVVNATNCAVAVQKTMAERIAKADPAPRMDFRFDEARIYSDCIPYRLTLHFQLISARIHRRQVSILIGTSY